MEWFKKHPILSTILIFILITLPQAILNWLDIAGRAKEAAMPSLPMTHVAAQWILPGIGIALVIFLLSKIKRTSPETQSKPQYSLEAITALDSLISQGKALVSRMQTPDFQTYTTENIHESVRQWLDNIDGDIWKLIPASANYIVADQGDVTEQEKLRYQGWKWGSASLRISVDRRLSRLREVRSEMRPFDSSQSEWSATIMNEAVVGLGFGFFPNRDILTRHHPLSQRVKDAPTIWALWHAGTIAYSQDAIKNGNITRLILPNPRGEAPIDKTAKLIGKSQSRPLIEDIVRITKEVLDKRTEQDQEQVVPIKDTIEVKWYPGITTISLMIGNPEPLSNDTWVQVELLTPLGSNKRPSFVTTYGQTAFKDMCKYLQESYKYLWSEAKSLTEDDIKWIQEFGK